MRVLEAEDTQQPRIQYPRLFVIGDIRVSASCKNMSVWYIRDPEFDSAVASISKAIVSDTVVLLKSVTCSEPARLCALFQVLRGAQDSRQGNRPYLHSHFQRSSNRSPTIPIHPYHVERLAPPEVAKRALWDCFASNSFLGSVCLISVTLIAGLPSPAMPFLRRERRTQNSSNAITSKPPTAEAIPMPALAPLLRPVFGVQVSPIG